MTSLGAVFFAILQRWASQLNWGGGALSSGLPRVKIDGIQIHIFVAKNVHAVLEVVQGLGEQDNVF